MGRLWRLLGLEPDPDEPLDMRAELFENAWNLVRAVQAVDGVFVGDWQRVKDLPKPKRKLYRERRLARMRAEDALTVTLWTIYYHGWAPPSRRPNALGSASTEAQTGEP